MRALLVQAKSPITYWGYQHSLRFLKKKATLPPLGLVSLAALLPRAWSLQLVDLNVTELTDAALAAADVVLVTGMLVHQQSMREVLERCRAMGRRTVVGGPAVSTSPELFPEADHVFQGEAEGRLNGLIAALEGRWPHAPRVLSPAIGARPPLEQVPVPRFDLLDAGQYASLSIQFSRGCPFSCEFCDVVELFGRSPRVKTPAQVIAELEALRAIGYRGTLFVVDDNFIGNRKAVAQLLPKLAAWQRAHGRPFELYTEASVDLATHPELVASMVDAGFTTIFAGLESPAVESLKETGKLQNLRLEPSVGVGLLTRAGLEVMAGFIVGFDSDNEGIFAAQEKMISSLPIPLAMVGLLTALPGTALWRRLEKEQRLRREASGDQFGRPNFVPRLDEVTLLTGYRALLARLYETGAYYQRCEALVDQLGRSPPTRVRPGGVAVLARAMKGIGLEGEDRARPFWRLLSRAAWRTPHTFVRAIGLAVQGEHLIRYTREQVLPRLDLAIAQTRGAWAAVS